MQNSQKSFFHYFLTDLIVIKAYDQQNLQIMLKNVTNYVK